MEPKKIRYELRDYQVTAHQNMRTIYSREENGRLACAASPTGSGKSFLAMAEIVQAKERPRKKDEETAKEEVEPERSWLDKEDPTMIDSEGEIHNRNVLYIAPTNSILSQVKLHIVKSLLLSPYDFSSMSIADINKMMEEDFPTKTKFKKIELDPGISESSLSADDKKGLIIKNLTPHKITEMVKRAFPGLVLKCYAGINGVNISDEEKVTTNEIKAAELIILDEAHRILADTWKSDVQVLLDNNHTARILALTATPERADKGQANVMGVLAKMVYPDKTLMPEEYMASDMYVLDAVRDGKVNAPEIHEPDFSIIRSKQYGELVVAWESETDPDKKAKLEEALTRIDEEVIGIPNYHHLKEKPAKAAIEDQIQDTVKEAVSPTGKYIAFIPANLNKQKVNKDGKVEGITQEQYFVEQAAKIREHFAKVVDENGKRVPITISYVSSEGAGIIDENGVIHPPKVTNGDGKLEEVSQKDAADVILQQFEGESSTSGGIKIVLSIDKISEGVHVDGIDGVLMCRPIGDNSTNVYLQQTGRAISSMDPNKPFEAHKKTKVIDLVGNTFKQVVAGKTTKTSRAYDLQKIKELSEWIAKNKGEYPKINSKAPDSATDKEKAAAEFEARCAITLKSLKSKYNACRNGYRPFRDRKIVDEIMQYATSIKLFETDIGDRTVEPSEEELTGGGFLSLNPKQQEFMKIYEEQMVSIEKDKKLSQQDKVIKLMNILKILYTYRDRVKKGKEFKLPTDIIISSRYRNKSDKIVTEDLSVEEYEKKKAKEKENRNKPKGEEDKTEEKPEPLTLKKFLEEYFDKSVIDLISIDLKDSIILEDGESGKHLTNYPEEAYFDFGKALAEVRGMFWSSQSYFYTFGVNLFKKYSVKELIEFGVLDDARGQYRRIETMSHDLSSGDIHTDDGPDLNGRMQSRGVMFITNNSTARNSYGSYGCDVGILKEYEDTSLTTGERIINDYDAEGYDKDGYDKDGYNRFGFNRERIHKLTGEPFDERGFYYNHDTDTWLNLETGTEYDLLGYNIIGLNSKGFERPKSIDDNRHYRPSKWYMPLPDGTKDTHSYEYSRPPKGNLVGVSALGFDKNGYYVDPVTGKSTKSKFDPRGFNAEGYCSLKQSDYNPPYNKKNFTSPYDKNGFDANGFNKEGFKEITITGEDGSEKTIFVHRKTSQIYDENGKVYKDGKLQLHEDVAEISKTLNIMVLLGLPYETVVEELHKQEQQQGKNIPLEEFKAKYRQKMQSGIIIMKRANGAFDGFEEILSGIKDDPEKIKSVIGFLNEFPELKKFLPIRTRSLDIQLKHLEKEQRESQRRNPYAHPYSPEGYRRKERAKNIEKITEKKHSLEELMKNDNDEGR